MLSDISTNQQTDLLKIRKLFESFGRLFQVSIEK